MSRMDSVITLRVDHSHLFPGAVLHLPDSRQLSAHPAECLLQFSDESEAEANFVPDHSAGTTIGRLLVSGYTTGAGTVIEAKNWHLRMTASGEVKVTHHR